jgi:exodeoxyribonuclease V gamma subunit
MLLSETEIFGLDKLQEWSIKNILLHHDDSSIQTLRDKWVKTGSLPLKNVADLTLKNIDESVQPIKQLFQNCIGDNPEEIENIHLSIPNLNIEITGSINQIYNQQVVVVSWSKNENKYLLEGYLKYLLANAAGIELKLAFISSVKEKIYFSKTISQEDALNQLNTLVKIFLRGKQKTICFYPDLNIKIQAIPYCTYVDFSKAIDKKFKTSNYSSTDIYGLIKYREGFFNNEAAFTQYQFIGEHVLSAIDKILPTYFE